MTKIIGQVYRYNKKIREGYIVGRDNRQYRFVIEDYHGKTELREGNLVEFKLYGQQARELQLLT